MVLIILGSLGVLLFYGPLLYMAVIYRKKVPDYKDFGEG